MPYRNAAELLPEALLRQVQAYAAGQLLYVPKPAQRKPWGASSGARVYYAQRNDELRRKFLQEGRSLQALSEEYHLSPETLRRILYQ